MRHEGTVKFEISMLEGRGACIQKRLFQPVPKRLHQTRIDRLSLYQSAPNGTVKIKKLEFQAPYSEQSQGQATCSVMPRV